MTERHIRILLGTRAAGHDGLNLETIFRAANKEWWEECPEGCRGPGARMTGRKHWSPRDCVDTLAEKGYIKIRTRGIGFRGKFEHHILLFITRKGETLLEMMKRKNGQGHHE